MRHLAVDIGSTRIKAALIDPERQCIKMLSQYPMPYLPTSGPLFCEGDPEALYQILLTVLCTQEGLAPEEPLAVRLSTQMHGFILTNPFGQALTPYISWQDNRCLRPSGTASSWLAELEQQIPPERMRQCGVYLKAGLALCNVYSLLRAVDYVIPPGSHFCTLGSYLALRLTGQNVCHVSSAAATGFLNAEDGVWDQDLIAQLGLSSFRFPALLPANSICGCVSHGGRIISVYPDIGDQQAAVLGSLMDTERDVNLNLATAGQLSRLSSHFSSGQYETRPYFEGQYLNTVTRLPAGRNLDVFIRFLQEAGIALFDCTRTTAELYQRLTPLISDANSALSISLSFFPDMLDGDDGGISGIRGDNFTIGNLLCGAYRTIGATYLRYLNLLEGNGSPARLVLTGGALQSNPTLCEQLIQTIGLPHTFAPCADEVMLGHYRLCLIDQGYCDTLAHTRARLCRESGIPPQIKLCDELQFK